MVIILTVAAGVGALPVLSVVNTLKQKFSLNNLLLVLYILVFVLALFIPKEFQAVAFDAGGVTTGPITVPFIMALGIGVAASHRGSKNSEDNSFGMVALCSIGPILAVLIMGLCLNGAEIAYTPFTITDTYTSREAGIQFLQGLPEYMREVALGLLPVVVFLRSVPDLCPAPEKRRPHPFGRGRGLHLCRLGAVFDRRQRGLYARRQLPGRRHCQASL